MIVAANDRFQRDSLRLCVGQLMRPWKTLVRVGVKHTLAWQRIGDLKMAPSTVGFDVPSAVGGPVDGEPGLALPARAVEPAVTHNPRQRRPS